MRHEMYTHFGGIRDADRRGRRSVHNTRRLSAREAGDYTLALTAREDTYDGIEIGTSHATATFIGDQSDLQAVSFYFDPLPAAPTGEVVTFELTPIHVPASGDTEPFYAYQTDSPNGIVKQTVGTSPPLDGPRRDEIAIRVYE